MIYVKLTNGFGNNLFQYIAGKLLAEHHKKELVLIPPFKDYYGLNELMKLGIKFDTIENQIDLSSCELITERDYLSAYKINYNETNLVLEGYFEDYTYYYDHLKKIRSWFPFLTKRANNDLVMHIRMGERLLIDPPPHSRPRVENYIQAIQEFDFDELHIVTDMPKWETITETELQAMKFHITPPSTVPIEEATKYFNELVEGITKFNPVVQRRTVGEDFNFVRSFKNILFEHGTMSWWAAVLSNAVKVGVYGLWRPWKGAKNKNLSQIPLDGWFKW